MTVAATAQPLISPIDRLGLTMSLAILVHAMFILGVTFTKEEKPKPLFDTMEIVIVQQKSKKPDEADFLAQASLEGGGDSEEKLNPATPLPAPFPEPRPQVTAPPPAESQTPQPARPPTPEKQVEKPEPESATPVEKLAVKKTVAAEAIVEKVTRPKPEQKQAKAKTKPESMIEPDPVKKKTRIKKVISRPRTPSATELLANSFKIASLSAEIRRKMEAKAKRPRRKFISANTQEYNYASYMEAWRAKVERVGNLNYPDAARKQNLSGNLVLDVALNPDGSINDITIRRSSGQKILDDAAIRIVKLASPYAPFPEQISNETDILHIMRTWQFINNRSFR